MKTHTAQGQGVFTLGVEVLKSQRPEVSSGPTSWLQEPSLPSFQYCPSERGKASRALGEERGHGISLRLSQGVRPSPEVCLEPDQPAPGRLGRLRVGAPESPPRPRPLAPAAGAFLRASIPPAASLPPSAPPCLVPPPHPRRPGPCVGFDSEPGAWLRQTTPHWTLFKLLQALKLGLEPERKY